MGTEMRTVNRTATTCVATEAGHLFRKPTCSSRYFTSMGANAAATSRAGTSYASVFS